MNNFFHQYQPQSQESGQRGRYVKKACLNCHKAHQACSEERPCLRCATKGLECVEKPKRTAAKQQATTEPESAQRNSIPQNHPTSSSAPMQQFFSSTSYAPPFSQHYPATSSEYFPSLPPGAYLPASAAPYPEYSPPHEQYYEDYCDDDEEDEIEPSSNTTTPDITSAEISVLLGRNLDSFVDKGRTEMSIWHRKTLALIFANSTFNHLNQVSTGEVVYFFDKIIRKSAQASLIAGIKHMKEAIIDTYSYGAEPIIKNFWFKFYIFDVDGVELVSAHMRVEPKVFFFERSRYRIGNVEILAPTTTVSEDMDGYFWDEWQVNDGEIQRSPFFTGRSMKSLIVKVAEYVHAQRSMYLSSYNVEEERNQRY